MGWYEQTRKTNQRIDALEKEVKSLKDEMTSLKRTLTEKRINGRDYLATGDTGEGYRETDSPATYKSR